MFYPKLKTRPRSTRTITDFRGLWHNLEDKAQISNQTLMRWYDERNLSADASPAMGTRGGRVEVRKVDGNIIPNKIIAAECSGNSAVILDDHGILYCHGNSINTLGANGTVYYWKFVPTTENLGDPHIHINPASGNTNDNTDLGGLLTNVNYTRRFKYRPAVPGVFDPENDGWELYDGETYIELCTTIYSDLTGDVSMWYFSDYGFSIDVDNALDDDYYVDINTWAVVTLPDYEYIVRMGANVIIMPEGVMVNAAKLEAGEEVQVEAINAEWYLPTSTGVLTFSPCLIDGTIITPVKGSTPPSDTTKIWADITGEKTVFREYIAAYSSWQPMPQTYVRIDIGDLEPVSERVNGNIKQNDAVTFGKATFWNLSVRDANNVYVTGNTADEMYYLLNSSQVVYTRKYDETTTPATDYIVFAGILDEAVTVKHLFGENLSLKRKMPQMDYIVECGNRLWGCYYGPGDDGEILNEIYASKLGDPTNWQCYQVLSTASWTASRGRNAPFTGAAVLDNCPLFFREQSLEKVYPSSSGAHQIQTFDVDGVEPGGHKTLCVVENMLFYKATRGVMVYDGTRPRLISAAFHDLRFKGLSAARYKRRYLLCMRDYNIDAEHPNGHLLLGVYDIPSGDWHIEEPGWEGVTVTASGDRLYYSAYVPEHGMVPAAWLNYQYSAGNFAGSDCTWYAETGIIGYELPEHRFISCIRIRFQLMDNSTGDMKVYIQYDDSRTWLQKADVQYAERDKLGTHEVNIYPRRCDHFRLKLTGTGECKVVSFSYRMERSEGGH